MKRNKDAGIHTGRRNRDGRSCNADEGPRAPRGSKRQTPLCEICDWVPPAPGSAFCHHCQAIREKTQARHEGVDGLHSRKTET